LPDFNREICQVSHYPLGSIVELMKHDMRRMAIGVVGVPGEQHPAADYNRQHLSVSSLNTDYLNKSGAVYAVPVDPAKPLRPDVTLDDVVIHYRCGDIIRVPETFRYFYKFEFFARFIPASATRIGIVTSPFDKIGHFREWDLTKNTGDRCRLLVEGLVIYLKERFPAAAVSVHNGPDESLALAIARMVMASTLIVSGSTLANVPAVTNFGKAYLPIPTQGFSGWLHPSKYRALEKGEAEIVRGLDCLVSKEVVELWDRGDQELIVEWHRNDTYLIEGYEDKAHRQC
jgi:hypothetical protein